MSTDLEDRIQRAVNDVILCACETFLDIDDDQFHALTHVTASAVIAEINRKPPPEPEERNFLNVLGQPLGPSK